MVFPRLGFVMPIGLKRIYGRRHLHFITFSCYRRLPLLKTVRARDVFVRELARARAEYELVGHPNWSFQFLPEPPAKILEVAFAGVDAVLVDSRPLAAFLPPGRLAL